MVRIKTEKLNFVEKRSKSNEKRTIQKHGGKFGVNTNLKRSICDFNT